jgi:O-antigen ligase
MKSMTAVPHRAPAAGSWQRRETAVPAAKPAAGGAAVKIAGASETSALSFFLFCVLTYAVVGRPNDYILALVPFRIALVMTAITGLVTLLEGRTGGVSPFRHRETKLYLTLYGAMLFGIPFAMHRGVTFDLVVITYAANMLYFILFVTHVTSLERLRQVLWVLVIGALLFTAFGLLYGSVRSDRFFIGSGMYDPNDAAYVELALLPFALCILLGSPGLVKRGVSLASALFGTLVALYTGSRGGLLGYLTFLLLFLNLRIGVLKPIHKILLLTAAGIAIIWNADKINTERFMTLTSIQSDYNYAEEWGRTDVWKNGIILFLMDPLTGVGANNFGMAIGNRRDSLGLLPKWQAPHNSFIQILTEIGIVGFVAWVLLLKAAAVTFWRLRRSEASSPNAELSVWAGVLFAGFIAQLLSASFLTMGYSIFFTVYFALSVALRRIAETSSPAAPESTEAKPQPVFTSRPLPGARGPISQA